MVPGSPLGPGPRQRAGVLTAMCRQRNSAGGPCRRVVAGSAAQPSHPRPGFGGAPPHADADRVLPTAASECILCPHTCPSQSSSPKCTPHLHPAGAQGLAGPSRGPAMVGGHTLRTCSCPAPTGSPHRSARHPHLADVISSGAGPGGGGGAGRNPRPWQQRHLCFQQLEKLRPAVGG